MSNKKNNNKDFPFGWLDFGGSIAGVAANVLSTILTNKKNEKLTRLQNAFQKQENELAYQRAKPQNQVAQMMQAGMSKAGALNAINGGATYQPAPISAATAQAPEIDLSTAFDGLMQIGENAKQRELQENLLNKQLKAAEDAQKAQFEENERQRNHELLVKDIDTANQTQHDYIEYQKHLERLNHDKNDLQLRRDSFEYGKKLVDAQTRLTDSQRKKLDSELEEWKKEPFVSARENKARLERISAIYGLTVTQSDFYKYLSEYYTYDKETDTYTPIYKNNIGNAIVGNLRGSQDIASEFWNLIFSIVPIKPLLDCIKLFGT